MIIVSTFLFTGSVIAKQRYTCNRVVSFAYIDFLWPGHEGSAAILPPIPLSDIYPSSVQGKDGFLHFSEGPRANPWRRRERGGQWQ